jgi:hypothetical protein
MKLRPAEATEYLKNNLLLSSAEFAVDVTDQEFEQLYSAVKELRGRLKWVEPFVTDDDLNAFLREVVRADFQIRFTETFPAINEVEWEVHICSRQTKPEAAHSRNGHVGNGRKTLRSSRG